MVKCLSLALTFFATLTLIVLPQSTLFAAKKDVELGLAKEWQTTITFEVFDREFISTNSAEDYHRSFQRLVANYRINISDEKLSEILLPLSSVERAYVMETVSSLVLEANDFSVYKDNHYYNVLNAATSEITKLNMAAALEVALVEEYNNVAAVETLFTSVQSADIRFVYLVNHARYEILNATLQCSSQR